MTQNKALTRAWGTEHRVRLGGAGPDKARTSGSQYWDMEGPGVQGLPGGALQKRSGLAWCSQPPCPSDGSSGGGQRPTLLDLRTLPPTLGHGCPDAPEHLGQCRASSYLGSVHLIQHHHGGAVIVEHQPPEVCHGVG